MDINKYYHLEEELFESKCRRESAGEWSSDTPQGIVAKQTRKRPREPTVKIEEKKEIGPKGKVGDGPVGWVRPLYLHSENDCLVLLRGGRNPRNILFRSRGGSASVQTPRPRTSSCLSPSLGASKVDCGPCLTCGHAANCSCNECATTNREDATSGRGGER